jgi:hypothetical protein
VFGERFVSKGRDLILFSRRESYGREGKCVYFGFQRERKYGREGKLPLT